MARENVFALNPVDYELERQKADRQGRSIFGTQDKAPKTPSPALNADGTPDYAKIATETQVPRNLVIALTEAAGLKDGAQKGAFATEAASRIGREISGGKDAKAALKAVLGEDAPVDDLITAARAVPEYERVGVDSDKDKPAGDDGGRSWLDPSRAYDPLGLLQSDNAADARKQVAGGVAKGAGAAVEGFGILRSSRFYDPLNLINEEGKKQVSDATRKVADSMRDYGKTVQEGVTKESRDAIKASTPDGDIFKPSTWTLGEDPSVRGYTMLTMDVLGSLAPVVVASVIGGPGAGAVAGGLQSGGAGAEEARGIVMAAANEMVEGPDGEQISRLEADSQYYRDLRADGESHEVATQKTAEAAGRLAATYAAPVGALGGAITGGIVTGGVKSLAGRSVGTRVAGGAALSATEEAAQETAEGVAARKGASDATGMDVDLWEGSFGAAILGALGGGPLGAAGGLVTQREEQQEESQPAPQAQLPAPDAPIDGEIMAPEAMPEPTGPISRAAQQAPEGAAEAMAQGQETGMFPDMKPGGEVALRDADGRDYNAVFLREDQSGVTVRIAGQEVPMSAQEFDEARAEVQREDEAEGEAPAAEEEADPLAMDDETPPEMTQPAAEIELPEGVDRDDFEERAAILEEGAGMDRASAEARALEMIQRRMEEQRAVDEQAAIPDAQEMGEQGQVEAPEVVEAPSEPEPIAAEPPASVETPEPEPAPATPDQPELITVTDVYGDKSRVRKADLDSDQPMLRRFNAKGEPIENDGALIARGNIDTDGTGVTETYKDQPVIGIGRQGDQPSKSKPGVRQAIKNRGQKVEDFEIREVKGGFIGVRKSAMAEPTAEDAAEPEDVPATGEDNEAAPQAPTRGMTTRPGYTRRMEGSESTTTQERMTEDGFVVTREVNRTTVRDPKGRQIFVGEHDVDEGKVERDIEKAREPETAAAIEAAAAETDPDPTPAQAEAENYKTGKAQWAGLTLSFENRKGGERSGTDANGNEWSVTMPAHYGRILRTEGADGDHVDFYMGDSPGSDAVWVIDQMDAETGRFDEHKVMLGFDSVNAAAETYMDAFEDGKAEARLGGMRKMTVEGFKKWLEGDTTGPVSRPAKQQDAGAQAKPKTTVDESNVNDPDMPAGFQLTAINRMTKPQAKDAGVSWPAVKAIVTTSKPYSWGTYEGISETSRADAIQKALSSAQRAVEKRPQPQATPKPAPTAPQPPIDRLESVVRLVSESEGMQETGAAAVLLPALTDFKRGTSPDAVIPQLQEASQLLFRQYPETSDVLDEIVTALEQQAEQDAEPEPESPSVSNEKPEPDQVAPPKSGILGTLSQEKQDRAAELKKRLADKARSQTSSGIDPEYITLGGELVALYIEGGTRKFGQMLRDFAETTGLSMREAQGPMRAAYNYVRDEKDLAGEDVSDMDGADAVMAEIRAAIAEESAPAKPEQAADDTAEAPQPADPRSEVVTLADYFQGRLSDGAVFKTIVGARKEASQVLGRDLGESDLKMVEEAMESGVVQAARDIAATDRTDAQKYDDLVDLYGRQPNLTQRTSSSIQYQAYSTPAPMAYLASRLAGITKDTTVYEPSAGTGMLLMEAAPRNVDANELQASRYELLNRIYAEGDIARGDAMQDKVPDAVDVVIANPPFGKVKNPDGRGNTEWDLTGTSTTTSEIDHAISMRALSGMRDDGSAVLIVGGHQGDAEARKTKYRTPKNRVFWKKLYETYNVTEHFTLDGGLYSRQGAGWPVDVVVIKGRGKSGKFLPMKQAPMLYDGWGQLRDRIDGAKDSLDPRGGQPADDGGASATAGQAPDTGGVSGASTPPVRTSGQAEQAGGARPSGDGTGTDGAVGRPDAQQQPGDTGNAGDTVGNPDDQLSDGAVPGPAEQGDGNARGPRSGQAGTVQRPSDGNLPDSVDRPSRAKVERDNTETETDFQVQYSPRSNAKFAVGTLVPKNVADSVGAALSDLDGRVGDIDDFVARELGYDVDDMLGTDSKRGYFSAEQVDAIALAIDNVGDGLGFIIGDQTGVGKGRIVAGMIRYALKQGKTPVFFTVKPGLYGDMLRDLRDIGMTDIQSEVMVTNNGLRASNAVPISARPGDVLASGTNAEQDVAIRTMRDTGALPEGKRVLFTTYDQMNTQKKDITSRMRAMQAIAPNAMFILDESHEAGGTANNQEPKAGDPEPRSVFIRKLLAESPNGKMFSSATFAKNSAVMSLYTSTNLRNALPNAQKLEEAVERGGVPMQQIISAALVKDGQYVRRERTYEGISMSMQILESDPIAAENGAAAVRAIFRLDEDYMTGVRDAYIEEELSNQGDAAGRDDSVGEAGASSTNFASTMHNVVSQLLLSVKATEVADKAVELHKQGKKPIIALSNTNASIINDYVNDRDLQTGDKVKIPFNEILTRYLNRLRRITIKNDDDTKEHYFLTDSDIRTYGGPMALEEVRATEKLISEIDLGDLPGSPIDAIRDKMEAAGIKVGEITGRSKQIRNGVLETRKGGQAENKRIMNGYNSGANDALIINRSGATGFSMHATDAPDNDGKTRAMLILQPDNNIDVFMQMLGRINRTGQTKLPEYVIAVSDLAVEKRPAALLMKKLASLNASTTANKKSAVTMDDAPDFMNKYGDQVVRQYLIDNPEVSIATGVKAPPKATESAGIAAKLTGKLIVLGPKRTEEIYADIQEAYQNYIDELDSMGANDLEAKVLEIDAKTEDSEVIDQGTAPDSAFGRDTVLETVDAKVIGKPYTLEKLDELVEEARDSKSIDSHVDAQTEAIDAVYSEVIEADNERRRDLQNRAAEAKTEKQKDKIANMQTRHETTVQSKQDRVRQIKEIVRQMAPGRPLMVSFLQNGETQETVYATALGVDLSRMSDSVAPSKMSVKIALASPGKQVTIPMGRLVGEGSDDYSITTAREQTVRNAFEKGQAQTRETRQIVTGNVINGFSKFSGKGQIVMFRRDDGTLDQGLLLPKDFSAMDALAEAPRAFANVDQAIRFAAIAGTDGAPALLKTADGVMTVQRTQKPNDFQMTIERTRGYKPYIFNPVVRDMLGDFTARSGPFKKSLDTETLRQVLSEYETSLGTEFQATAHKEEAQDIIDASKPQGRRRDAGDASPAPYTREAFESLKSDLQDELNRIGISGQVRLRVAKGFRYDGTTLDGFFHEGVIGAGTGSDVGARGVMRHEVIHAMRNRALWGRDYGLFTEGEWQAMVRAARNNRSVRDRINRTYPDLNTPQKSEEMVAEAFREWMDQRDTQDSAGRAFEKLRRIVEAFLNALRRNGANEAAEVFERIRSGEIGGRGPGGGRGVRGPVQGMRRDPASPKGVPMGAPRTWRSKGKDLWNDLLTDSMGGRTGKANVLALVPGRPLFEELGRNLPSARVYLKLKDLMDTLRQEWHAKTDELARDWMSKAGKDTEANGRMMDLMHRSTLAGIDPSKAFDPGKYSQKQNRVRAADYDLLRAEFKDLPPEFQTLFRKVRDDYSEIADEFEKAIVENVRNAQRVAVKRAQRAHDKEMQRIADEGLTGKEKRDAAEDAKAKLKQAKARMGWAQNARIAEMRQQFESNRLQGVYFPLARFGSYFVAARDSKGKVVSFSRFEKQRKQREEAKKLEAEGYTVDTGVLGAADTDLKTMVDPTFVADMENLLATWDVEPAVMDTVWQRWLETLPDQSIRTNRIHRKGRQGYQKDALRAYTHHMFHGSHQLARLKYGLQMQDAIDEAYTEAAQSSDSNRATLVVDEMNRRHQWTMNPQVSGASTAITSLAFVWYLGATPAAAMVNLTQTTIMGIPIMNAAFRNASVGEIARQLGRAGLDFASGRGDATASSRLSQDEKDALESAHKRGIITRTQGHDLASVAETGVEYSGTREKIMRFFSYLFHKAEVANREVTFLAAYRMAMAEGGTREGAVDKAGSVTWKTHFDYQGSSRPRFMQGDWPRVFFIFRQFQVNAIYRLFRDTYQTFEGKTDEERREAKAQLVGISLSMMAHAGITGVWGYGLITTLLGLFSGGDDDDIDEWLHDALLMEGNSTGTAAWNYMMGMALKGVPGQISEIALSERIGIPNLWFRGPFYDMDAQDTVTHYVHELAGPAASIVFSMGRGMQYMAEQDWWRGAEAMVPKMARDISKGVRYTMDGVETRNGDPILEDVSPYEAIVQAMGFTPARLAERYDDMSRMRDAEKKIIRERSSLHGDIAKAVSEGGGMTPALLKRIRAFNQKHPTFPITGSSIRRSIGSRQRWSEGVQRGVNINDKLRPGIERDMAPQLYD